MSRKAIFLVFEGLDGSGKSTLIRNVLTKLAERGIPCAETREPGGTPLAEEIRNLLLRTEGESPVAATELLLYAASRAQHVAGVIKPQLQNGKWVVCDRFTASSVAFQSFARGLPRENVDWLNRFACQGIAPDLTILLDLTVAESRRRQGVRHRENRSESRSEDRIERESEIFHELVRKGYLQQAHEQPTSWLVLNAEESPENLTANLMKELERRGWLKL